MLPLILMVRSSRSNYVVAVMMISMTNPVIGIVGLPINMGLACVYIEYI